jgi:hypothetical protein
LLLQKNHFFHGTLPPLANRLHPSTLDVSQRGSNAAVVQLALHHYQAKQQEIFI